MGQKDGEKWTAVANLQPTISKSDRLLGMTCITLARRWECGSGWGTRHLFAANSRAIGKKSNAVDHPRPRYHRPQGVVQVIPRARPHPAQACAGPLLRWRITVTDSPPWPQFSGSTSSMMTVTLSGRLSSTCCMSWVTPAIRAAFWAAVVGSSRRARRMLTRGMGRSFRPSQRNKDKGGGGCLGGAVQKLKGLFGRRRLIEKRKKLSFK